MEVHGPPSVRPHREVGVSPSQLRHETSAATTGLLLRYVEARGGRAAVEAVLARAELPHTYAELTDESRWFSYADRIALFEATAAVFDDPEVTFAVGASAVTNGLAPSMILLVRALGSPRQVFRQLAHSAPKFTTASTLEVLESGETHAVLRLRLHEGFVHSRHDCRYAQGLFTTVPVMFGLPPARVLHDECESDGKPACIYHVTWDRRTRGSWRRRRTHHGDRTELVALRGQLEALQLAASDLVGSDDLTVALERIVARAGAAVVAPAHLCVVESPDGHGPLVHSAGLSPERAYQLTDRLRAGDELGDHAVVVPVSTARRHHGWLAALYPEDRRGPAGDRDLLRAYAGHAGAVLDQLVALEASRRGESRARALLNLAHDLAATTDPQQIAERVVAALPGIVGSTRATLLRWDPARSELRAVACEGFDDAERAALLAGAVRPDESPELLEMLYEREPVVLDSGSATPALRRLLLAVNARRFVAVPLLASDGLLGVATVDWPADTHALLGEEVVERLRGVADQAANALQRAHLLETVEHRSLHDALTGLPNRVLFARHLEAALGAAGDDTVVGILFCDLDRFKVINDTLGHAAGDELLRQVAARLRSIGRGEDLVARLSGDEFALVVQVTGCADAVGMATRLVACFAEPFRVEGRDLEVTTSVGVACRTGPDGNGDRLLRAADSAMYDAKQRGRNQVAVAGDHPAPPIG